VDVDVDVVEVVESVTPPVIGKEDEDDEDEEEEDDDDDEEERDVNDAVELVNT
jgi:hypothetical protein